GAGMRLHPGPGPSGPGPGPSCAANGTVAMDARTNRVSPRERRPFRMCASFSSRKGKVVSFVWLMEEIGLRQPAVWVRIASAWSIRKDCPEESRLTIANSRLATRREVRLNRRSMRPVLFLFAAVAAFAQTHVVDSPTASGANRFYPGNRPPLAPNPLIKLPLGSVRPEGWLRRQLELEAKGFSGRPGEMSQFWKYDGNEWTSPAGQGKFGWEEVPYWLRGYIDLGYVLQDPAIIRRAGDWVNAVMKSQRPTGYFGSQSNIEGERVNGVRPRMLDLWPNMVMLFPLRSLHEATADARVLPFMTKYFQWQTTVPLEDFLPASWQKQRGGDNL